MMEKNSSPDVSDVNNACTRGFDAIDSGRNFTEGFANYLIDLGYVYNPRIPCTCPDNGYHGHAVECRWSRDD